MTLEAFQLETMQFPYILFNVGIRDHFEAHIFPRFIELHDSVFTKSVVTLSSYKYGKFLILDACSKEVTDIEILNFLQFFNFLSLSLI